MTQTIQRTLNTQVIMDIVTEYFLRYVYGLHGCSATVWIVCHTILEGNIFIFLKPLIHLLNINITNGGYLVLLRQLMIIELHGAKTDTKT